MFDSGELQAMSDEGLIDALRRAHGAAAFAQAAEVRAVRELYRRRGAAVEDGGGRAGEFAATEAAVAVQISEAVAAALIDIGLGLDGLPAAREAFGAGRIDLARAQAIVHGVRGLSDEARQEVEPRLVEAAVRSNPARLRQIARRWVTRLDPEAEQRRREQREGDRDVRIRAVQDGMAVFDGLLPAVDAQTVAMRLRELSSGVCEADPRTMPQRRADALVALADGSGQLRCRCGRGSECTAPDATFEIRRPLVQIGISAATLLGLRNDPAFLAGYGPVDPILARRVAEHARLQVIPEHTEEPNEPAEATKKGRPNYENESHIRLEREIRAIDGQCRFPGCTMPAAAGDPVPIRPIENTRGSSSPRTDLAILCPRHHRLKTLADKRKLRWRVHRLDAERMQWTGPTGDEHLTVREGALYLFPHTDIDAPEPQWPSPTTSQAPPEPATIDPAYPLEHPVLSRVATMTPEDDLPLAPGSKTPTAEHHS
ncbi:DUF222 domain-containing protein [Nocardia terpenica]|nr:DUF222 domain-containing protein [Nocardia terpenica]